MKDFQYYHKLSSRFNVPILMISAVNALTAICLNSFLDQEYVSIINAVLSAGTGVAGSVQLYLKINEKMTNATRSSIVFKRLALKISKELSIGREQRVTEGVPFLTECFAEFNTAFEQGNPVERQVYNHLALTIPPQPPSTPMMRRVADQLLSLAGRSVPSSNSSVDDDV